MKKISLIFVTFVSLLVLVSCGSKNTEDVVSQHSNNSNKNVENVIESKPKLEMVEMIVADFDDLQTKMPVYVASTKYVVQDEQYKSLYPDMLQAVIKNNTSHDIKNAVVAFVAWDKNNLPIKIKGSIDFSDGAYVRTVNYNDINLIPNATYGNTSGFSIDEACAINSFKAIVVSFETFEGESWENPYYDEWKKLYEGVKFSDTLTVDVQIENVEFQTKKDNLADDLKDDASGKLSETDLIAKLESEEMTVISTKYVVQDERYKSLYPDMLQAVIKNNTSYDIKNAVVAFVAWDKNNLPVKIKGSTDFSDGTYIKRVNYNDINLIPNGTYGKNSGFEVDENCGITTFKAIVVSYESFEGNTWENPYYDEWCKLYEGVKLK